MVFSSTFENQFRDEYFLVDPGAPYSYIMEDHLRDLKYEIDPIPEIVKALDASGVETRHTALRIIAMIEGTPVTFIVTNDQYIRENVRGVNILGTNFINEFYMSDDFHTEQLRFMKPAYKKTSIQASCNAFE